MKIYGLQAMHRINGTFVLTATRDESKWIEMNRMEPPEGTCSRHWVHECPACDPVLPENKTTKKAKDLEHKDIITLMGFRYTVDSVHELASGDYCIRADCDGRRARLAVDAVWELEVERHAGAYLEPEGEVASRKLEAADCPECGGTGEVKLFTSIEPCGVCQ